MTTDSLALECHASNCNTKKHRKPLCLVALVTILKPRTQATIRAQPFTIDKFMTAIMPQTFHKWDGLMTHT